MLLLVLASSLNLVVNMHYCGDFMTEMSLLPAADADDRCDCGAMGKSSCCEDVIVKQQAPDIVSCQQAMVFKCFNQSIFFPAILPGVAGIKHALALQRIVSPSSDPHAPPNEQLRSLDIISLRI